MTRTCGGDPQMAAPIADNGVLPIDRLLAEAAQEIIAEVCKRHGVPLHHLLDSSSRTVRSHRARQDAVLSLWQFGFSQAQIARHLRLSSAGVSSQMAGLLANQYRLSDAGKSGR